tara:strand:+ start:12494 stop:13051 length:558 start_codon:yes stop_codon:yes gene_type:complete
VFLGVIVVFLLFLSAFLYGKTPYYICTPEDLVKYSQLIMDGTLDPNEVELAMDPNCAPPVIVASLVTPVFPVTVIASSPASPGQLAAFKNFVENEYTKVPPCAKRRVIFRQEVNAPDGAFGGVMAIAQSNLNYKPKKKYTFEYITHEGAYGDTRKVAHLIWTVDKCPMAGMKAFAEFAKTYHTIE